MGSAASYVVPALLVAGGAAAIVATGGAATPLVLGAASAGVGAYATYQQQQAVKDAANYEAKVQRQNAVLADKQATDALGRGAAEEAAAARKLSAFKGAQRAGLAGTGVDLTATGSSAEDIQADTKQLGALDLLAVRQNAAREAYGYKVGATDARAGAALSSFRAQTTKPALAATGTLLSGASQVADSWIRYRGGS